MKSKFNAYEGNENFIFISYSHKDERKVVPIIDVLNNAGFNVWYDEKLNESIKYDDVIAEHIEKCEVFVALVSRSYAESDYCQDELKYALSNKKKVFCIYIEDIELPGGLKLRTNSRHNIVYSKYLNYVENNYVPFTQIEIFKSCKNGSKQAINSSLELNTKDIKKPIPAAKKKGKKHGGIAFIAVAVIALITVGLFQFGLIDTLIDNFNYSRGIPSTFNVGDEFTMGEYNGQKLVWVVLNVDSGGNALVVSKDAIVLKSFHSLSASSRWNTSNLRTWLNGTFLKHAFSDEDISRIMISDVSNTRNPAYASTGAAKTDDMVFLLSVIEATNYMETDNDRICHLSDGEDEGVYWWLRTVGSSANYAVVVSPDGSIKYLGYSITNDSVGVRPAMRLTPKQ